MYNEQRTRDSYNDYVHPLDEAAKQIYRDNPKFAIQVELLSYAGAGIFLAAAFAIALVLKVLG